MKNNTGLVLGQVKQLCGHALAQYPTFSFATTRPYVEVILPTKGIERITFAGLSLPEEDMALLKGTPSYNECSTAVQVRLNHVSMCRRSHAEYSSERMLRIHTNCCRQLGIFRMFRGS